MFTLTRSGTIAYIPTGPCHCSPFTGQLTTFEWQVRIKTDSLDRNGFVMRAEDVDPIVHAIASANTNASCEQLAFLIATKIEEILYESAFDLNPNSVRVKFGATGSPSFVEYDTAI